MEVVSGVSAVFGKGDEINNLRLFRGTFRLFTLPDRTMIQADHIHR